MNGYKVAYYNVYRLFQEIALARISSTLHCFFAKLAQTNLLILDDFGAASMVSSCSTLWKL